MGKYSISSYRPNNISVQLIFVHKTKTSVFVNIFYSICNGTPGTPSHWPDGSS